MFTKGFNKQAFDAAAAPRMPSQAAAEAVRKGMNKPVGEQMSSGWANLKSELGFGGAKNVGKMGS
jgi:hypothetical protein